MALTKPTDFNDLFALALERGLDRAAALGIVRQQIEKHLNEASMTEKVNDSKPMPAEVSLKVINPNINAKQTAEAELEIELNKEPIPLPDNPTVLKFDPEMLPTCIGGYVTDIARRQQCPIDFVAVTAICNLAALLGRKALIKPKQNDDWVITPNVWGAIIGRPSAMKTPAMNAASAPSKSFETEAAIEYEKEKKEHKVNQEVANIRKSSAAIEAKKFIKDEKIEDAKKALAAVDFNDPAPTRKRLVVNDASVEKLGELLNENPNGLLLVRDELIGLLSKLMMEENQAERAFYLECFNGNGSYTYDRITRGTIEIKNAILSIIGGIQPSKIEPLIRGAIKGIGDDGLVQRLQLAVWPDDDKNWEWIDEAPNAAAKQAYEAIFKKIYDLPMEEEPPTYKFTDAAQNLFIEWMKEIQTISRSDDIHPALESHLLKMPKTVASLALIFQIIINLESEGTLSEPYEVDEDAITYALDWADYLISHAERLYSLATNKGLSGARLILKRIDKLNDEFTAREIHRKNWSGLTDIGEVEAALLYLADYKHLVAKELPSSTGGGRPTITYIKNKKYTKNGAM